MEARWIIVRDRQAGLLAEAEAERLARLVRESAAAERVDPVADPSADASGPLFASGRRLRRVEAAHVRADARPVAVEVERDEWLAAQLPGVPREAWERPHSAFVLEAVRLEVAVEREAA